MEKENLKHFSLFSGIESFKKALTNLGIENELVGYSEFDKYASVSLSAIHGVSEELNYGDITKIDETKVPDCDLITYGFPCQDISVAGLGKGIVEGETRSGLLFDALRIIKYKKPKYAIAENVKNLVGKRFKEDFEGLLAELESYGYNNYWKVLNAKDYGIPQNRERVFIVSIRKDVDDGKFEFPKPLNCDNLDFRDYLSEDGFYLEPSDYDKVKGLGAKYSFGGVVKDNTRIYNTITASYGKVSGNSMKFTYHGKYRYLTPKECWRLMGFTDEDYHKARQALEDRFYNGRDRSNSQMYKMAGNSIVVDVLEGIFKQLFNPNENNLEGDER